MSVPLHEAWRKDFKSIRQKKLRRLMLAMAYFYNEDEGYAFPTKAQLADRVASHPKNVQKDLRELERMGFIVPQCQQKGGKGINNQWSVLAPPAENVHPVRDTSAERGVETAWMSPPMQQLSSLQEQRGVGRGVERGVKGESKGSRFSYEFRHRQETRDKRRRDEETASRSSFGDD